MTTIRPVAKEDLPAVAELTVRVFQEFIAPGAPSEGAEAFTKSTPRQALRAIEADHIFLLAEIDGRPVGLLGLTVAGHLFSLFVEGPFQRQGIGKSLLAAGLSELQARRPEVSEITLNSTLNGLAAYKRWGCIEVGDEVVRSGVRAVPMRLSISQFG